MRNVTPVKKHNPLKNLQNYLGADLSPKCIEIEILNISSFCVNVQKWKRMLQIASLRINDMAGFFFTENKCSCLDKDTWDWKIAKGGDKYDLFSFLEIYNQISKPSVVADSNMFIPGSSMHPLPVFCPFVCLCILKRLSGISGENMLCLLL